MDFKRDGRVEAFRAEVRQFLREKLPADLAGRPHENRSPRAILIRWQRILNAQGWGAPGWAREHGGTGWTIQQCLMFEEECGAAGTPSQDVFGQRLLGPVLNQFGREDQKAEHIIPTLNGDRLWCQGFSEPGSGSDLASLRTSAERDGEAYVINGQKIWTSFAHESDWIFLLVRTSSEARKQAGITFLLVDLKTPGIAVRPIISIDGRHHLNEVFFDNVRVPVRNRIGEEGQGWAITKFLLNNEHATTAELPALRSYLRQLRQLGAGIEIDGRSLIEDPEFSLRLEGFEAEMEAVAMMVLRVAAMEQAGDHSPQAHALGSMLKLRSTSLQKRLSSFVLEAIGDRGAVRGTLGTSDEDSFEDLPGFAKGVAPEMFYRRASTIYGGSDEIQRGIVAKLLFNL